MNNTNIGGFVVRFDEIFELNFVPSLVARMDNLLYEQQHCLKKRINSF